MEPAELFFTVYAERGPVLGVAETLLVFTASAPPAQSFYSVLDLTKFSIAQLPGSATLDPSQLRRRTCVMQPVGTPPSAGTYSDSVNFQFSDGRIQTLKVNVIAGAPGDAAGFRI